MKEEDFLTYNNTKQHIYIFDEVENPKALFKSFTECRKA